MSPRGPTTEAAPHPPDDRSPSGAPAVVLARAAVVRGGFPALRDVTLTIRAGEHVAILGPSGAGKSTLLRLVNTSLLPSSGRVEVLGVAPGALPSRRLRALRARIGTVWQQLQLVPQASVAENVRMGRIGSASTLSVALGGLSGAERARVAAVLAQVGLEDRMGERLDRLSGGEQQRVAVARVLYQEPDILLADEPLASVDPARAAEVVRLLVRAAHGRTLLLSTHQLEPVLPHFPRVVALRDGAVLFDARRDAVTADDLARLYEPVAARASGERLAAAPAGAADAATLRIAASTLPGDYLLPRILPALRARVPGARVSLTVADTAEALEALRAGAADLALVGARDARGDLTYEDVAEDEIVLVASPGFEELPPGPLAPSQLARVPRVDREPGSATRRVVEAQLAAMGAPLASEAAVLEAGSPEALKAAVLAGAGVGFASRISVAAELASGRLRTVPVARVRIPRRIFAAVRHGATVHPAVRPLLELVRAEAVALGAVR